MALRNSPRIESRQVHDILTNSASGLPKSSPVEHVGQHAGTTESSRGDDSRGTEELENGVAPEPPKTVNTNRASRASISFPTAQTFHHDRSRSSVVDPVANDPPDITSLLASPIGSNFLTAIAAQERRVLELKEELLHAEAELERFKKQWARHEARKKKSHDQSLAKLRSGDFGGALARVEGDIDGSNAWIQMEMERRKTLMNQNRPGTRTVFAGSKHTRALSLLSAPRTKGSSQLAQQAITHPQLRDVNLSENDVTGQTRTGLHRQSMTLTRASTTPILMSTARKAHHAESGIDGDILLKTGKRMATDLRDGFWTLWEDLRQATVGEEALLDLTGSARSSLQTATNHSNGGIERKSPLRMPKKSSAQIAMRQSPTSRARMATSKKSQASQAGAKAPALANPRFWAEHGFTLHTSKSSWETSSRRASAQHKSRPASVTESSSDVGWDAWDDVSVRDDSRGDSPSSSIDSEANTLIKVASSGGSSQVPIDNEASRPAKTNVTRTDPIPWPEMLARGPSTLQKTASRLMSEWEEALALQNPQQLVHEKIN